jgi:hypothetical protein
VPIENEITREILGYLVNHPQAQDTLEGIIHFWLLEQKITYQTKMVKEAIEELVESGLILERKIGSSETHYRINNEEFERIKEILRKRDK